MKTGHRTLLAPFQPAATNRTTGTPEPCSTKSLLSRIVGTALVAAAVLGTTTFLHAQGPADPSGHWQGAIHVPNQEIAIEVDLARNSTGDTRGTFSGVNIKGYPLSDIAIDGAAPTPAEAAAAQRSCILFDGNDAAAVEAARSQWRALTAAGVPTEYWSETGGRWSRTA